jgi:hypothetical protein
MSLNYKRITQKENRINRQLKLMLDWAAFFILNLLLTRTQKTIIIKRVQGHKKLIVAQQY